MSTEAGCSDDESACTTIDALASGADPAPILGGSNSEASAEIAMQVALVCEAGDGGCCDNRLASLEHPAGPTDAMSNE